MPSAEPNSPPPAKLETIVAVVKLNQSGFTVAVRVTACPSASLVATGYETVSTTFTEVIAADIKVGEVFNVVKF